MYYIVDYDTRSVETKHYDKDLLESYILGNDLDMAVALIGSKDELCLLLSIREMVDLYVNLTGSVSALCSSEKQMATATWDAIQTRSDKIPSYTKPLAAKLLKAAAKRNKDAPEPPSRKVVIAKTTTNITASKKRVTGDQLLKLGDEPKSGTALSIIYNIVEDNLDDMKFDNVIREYIFVTQCTDKLARRYVNKSIRLGYLEIEDEI